MKTHKFVEIVKSIYAWNNFLSEIWNKEFTTVFKYQKAKENQKSISVKSKINFKQI